MINFINDKIPCLAVNRDFVESGNALYLYYIILFYFANSDVRQKLVNYMTIK